MLGFKDVMGHITHFWSVVSSSVAASKILSTHSLLLLGLHSISGFGFKVLSEFELTLGKRKVWVTHSSAVSKIIKSPSSLGIISMVTGLLNFYLPVKTLFFPQVTVFFVVCTGFDQ